MRLITDSEQKHYPLFADANRDVLATGFKSLDGELPRGGWPTEGVLEIVTRQNRALAFQLLLPALAMLSRNDDPRWVVLVAPPFFPSRPGLLAAGVDLSRLLVVRPDAMHGIDVIERLLSNGKCAALLAWPMVENESLSQRLSEAAEQGGCLAVLFRDSVKRKPVAAQTMRVALHPSDDALLLDIQQSGMRARKMACQIPYAQLYHYASNQRLDS